MTGFASDGLPPRLFLAHYLRGAAKYHRPRGTCVEIDITTCRTLRELGVPLNLTPPGRLPNELLPSEAEQYATELETIEARNAEHTRTFAEAHPHGSRKVAEGHT